MSRTCEPATLKNSDFSIVMSAIHSVIQGEGAGRVDTQCYTLTNASDARFVFQAFGDQSEAFWHYHYGATIWVRERDNLDENLVSRRD